MTEVEVYKEIANRFIELYNEHSRNGISKNEIEGFCIYHAFESIGSGMLRHFRQNVSTRSHRAKLNAISSYYSFQRFRGLHPTNIATLVIAFLSNNRRNKFLYPFVDIDPNFIAPKDQLSRTEIDALYRRVRTIVNIISSNI